MASYTTEHSMDQEASSEDIKEMMVHKAHELFMVCDKEEKGFITKRDMQRLQNELPLTPEQLEDVFDSLDDDGNGYLTLEEFTGGFGSFLGLATTDHHGSVHSLNSVGSDDRVYEDGKGDNDDSNFNEMLDHVGAKEVFDDMDTIKNLWEKLKEEQPELLGSFEDFLGRVTTDIKRSQTDFQSLESALRNKSSNHDEEVRKLYEEMEQQIKLERDRVVTEEKAKERQMREEMEKDLQEKDRQLQELLLKHQEMESQLQNINQQDAETKQENEKLARERDRLETLLENSQEHLEDSRTHISDLKQKQRHDKRDRAMAALQISEGIALERESLVKQLEMLRGMNRKLRDERDEADIRRVGDRLGKLSHCDTCDENDEFPEKAPNHQCSKLNRENSMEHRRKKYAKRGSVMSDYIGDGSMSSRQHSVREESVEFDDTDLMALDANHNLHSSPYDTPLRGKHMSSTPQNDLSLTNGDPRRLDILSGDPNISPDVADRLHNHHTGRSLEASDSEFSDPERIRRSASQSRMLNNSSNKNYLEPEHIDTGQNDSSLTRPKSLADELTELDTRNGVGTDVDSDVDNIASSHRKEPVGANSVTDPSDGYGTDDAELSNRAPERLFKVVFVGDSGVGKSSFIHRFCSNSFKHTFSATIGVDFQVKNVLVEGHLIALQLWDTAGQERFRSITKQYFRKADGVIIMYDVTSETSYKNVQNWMVSVQDAQISQKQEGTDDGTVLTLIGNKMDLIDDMDDSRVVSTKAGSRLADDYGALFYETSAKTGLNVREAMQGMASLLQEREDRQIEKSFNVGEDDDLKKKKGCCD